MSEIDPDLHEFLGYWFEGWQRGMQTLDKASRDRVFHECGKARARSYTAQVFREARQTGTDMPSFLHNLTQRFPSARYEWDGDKTIHVIYAQCGCDLVRLGLVKSGDFCECSAANLRENFEQALETTVHVTIEDSILRGGSQCVLTVSLEKGT